MMAVPQKKRPSIRRKKKVCTFCAEPGETLSYKDVAKLRKYVSERGKRDDILLRRCICGICLEIGDRDDMLFFPGYSLVEGVTVGQTRGRRGDLERCDKGP